MPATEPEKRPRAWAAALITIGALAASAYTHELLRLIPGYRGLYPPHRFYIANSVDDLLGVSVCIAAVLLMRRGRWRGLRDELALSAAILPAVVFALAVSSPMLLGFAATRRFAPRGGVFALLFLTVLSPVAEEFEFRGFGVWQLRRATGWPFWVAVWPSALLFGLVHLPQGQSAGGKAGLFLLTTFAGVVFAWLMYRWESVFIPIALHISMNLWWELFTVSKTAIGGWLPLALQLTTVVLAVGVTLHCTAQKKSATGIPPDG